MSHRKWSTARKPPERQDRTWTTNCDEHRDKRLYQTKKAAKGAIRKLADRKGMREYRCRTRDGWHIGHMPQEVLRGDRTIREAYGR